MNESAQSNLDPYLQGYLDLVELMVENGVDPGAVRKNGYSAAHLSAASGQLETLKYLMSQGRHSVMS